MTLYISSLLSQIQAYHAQENQALTLLPSHGFQHEQFCNVQTSSTSHIQKNNATALFVTDVKSWSRNCGKSSLLLGQMTAKKAARLYRVAIKINSE